MHKIIHTQRIIQMFQNDNQTKKRSRRVGGWLTLSVMLHFVWLILFVWVLWFGPFDQILPRPEWLESCAICEHSADAISTASQMGRLDVVSIALTILGVVIGVAALGSYTLIRQAAMAAAQDEAYVWMDDNYKKLTPEILANLIGNQRFILTLVTELGKRVSDVNEDVSAATADDIAQAMDDSK